MTRARRVLAVVVIFAALVAASGCTVSAPRDEPPPARPPTIATPSVAAAPGWWRVSTEAVLASGLTAPWSVVPLDDGGALISQRGDGRILELTPGGDLRTAGVVPGVVSGGESGLHGLALLPGSADPVLYAYFGSQDDNRVVRMPLLGMPGSLSLGDPQPILTGIVRATTHDGGRLAFGPDGYLYVTTGDAQVREAAQDPDALGGKILRVTPDGAPAPGNPFGNEVYSLGHRNVQGLAWTADGTLWASEFGQISWDELNWIEAGGNYGWPVVEGVAGRSEFIEPVAQWATSEASPSGIAAVGDTVFVTGLRGERLWQVDTANGTSARDPVAALVGAHGRLRDVVAVADGSLWLLTNNTDGRGSPRAGDDMLLRLEVVPAT